MKENILGFQICGIGLGHLTQAKCVYEIIIKKYKIPIVVIYGASNCFDNFFKNSIVIYRKTKSNNNDINKMNYFKIALDVFSKKNTLEYERKFGINKWFNFWIPDVFNYRTKQIQIAYQIGVPHISIFILYILLRLTTLTKYITIQEPSLLTKRVIPPLIDLKKLIEKK